MAHKDGFSARRVFSILVLTVSHLLSSYGFPSLRYSLRPISFEFRHKSDFAETFESTQYHQGSHHCEEGQSNEVTDQYRITKLLTSTSNLPFDITKKKLIDMERVIHGSFDIIAQEAPKTTNPLDRKLPLLFSRLARGGKTSTLMSLFEDLKKKGYPALIISFNGDMKFNLQDNERPIHGILRLVLNQLIDQPVDTLTSADVDKLKCDLDKYIQSQTIKLKKPFILLIDELNVLESPLEVETSRLLKDLFLDPENRYLVASSHIPLRLKENDLRSYYMKSDYSSRGFRTVNMSQSFNLEQLKTMSSSCLTLTDTQIQMFSGFPSLILLYKEHSLFAKERFDNAVRRLAEEEKKKIFNKTTYKEFLLSLIDGSQLLSTDFFHSFGSIVSGNDDQRTDPIITYPLCYISRIFHEFLKSDCACSASSASAISQLIELIEVNIPGAASTTGTGLGFQFIVELAMLIRGLFAESFRVPHPANPEFTAKFGFMPLDSEVETVKQAESFIRSEMKVRESGSLILFTPQYGSFPDFDGFLVAKIQDQIRVTAFQAKAGDKTPKRKALPAFINRAILYQGKAPETRRSTTKWSKPVREQVLNFLGPSLMIFYPDIVS
jgi:hypothetical protein